MPLTSGTRLGPYEILSLLGSGGMGEVYKARDTRLDRTVAVKVLPGALADDPQFRERFDREARAISQLTHANICTLYDVGEHAGTAFLVMELVDGETLADRLERGALPLNEALRIAIQIADALSAAHRHGIVHRDLKPGNVMLTKAGAKLLDFGLAKASGPAIAGAGLSMLPTTPPHLTAQGTILGTFQYMAPEQLEGQEADARTDIFAFGAVLYEMLTGKKAFKGKSQASLIGAILKDDPPPVSQLQAVAPAALDRIVATCVAKDPDDRWQSVGDLKRDLQWIAESGGGGAGGPVPVAARRHAREYVAWGLTTLATLVAIGASALYLRAPRQASAIVRFTVAPPHSAVRLTHAEFAVAPDGQILAFTARAADGVSRIFVRRLDAAEAQPLAGTDTATALFWSPDGRSLGFAKEGGLYRTNLDGSAPRRLCDVPGGAGHNVLDGAWGPRGVIVFASIGAGLLQVPDTGGTPTPVTTLDAANKEVLHGSPSFLPDGRHVLFLALAGGQSRGVIWAVSIDSPARTRIAESSGGAAYADGWLLTTTAAPRGLVAQPFDPERLTLRGAPQPVRDRLTAASTDGPPGFSVSLTGALVVDRPPPIIHQLTWMDRVGRVVETIGPEAVIRDFALAPDGQRVVASVTDVDSLTNDLWLFEPQHQEGTRLTFKQSLIVIPMWDLDGRHVYFTTTANDLRVLAVGATESERFENPGAFSRFDDMTRDGRYLVFRSQYPITAIWIQRVGAPTERRALVQGQFGATQARVSPDGRWLAYTLALPQGTDVFVQPFNRPGDRLQVSRGGGIGAIWRADSRELYYEGRQGLMAVAMTERGGALDVGRSQKLFSLHTQGFVTSQPHNVEAAASGQKFLVNAIVGDSDNVPIEVTLNWTTGLKK